MATIPIYTKQVEEQALPGARQQSIASPALFDNSQNARTIGQGLTAIGDMAQAYQDKEDMAQGASMGAGFINQITDNKLEARKRTGDLAKGLPQESEKWYNESAKKLIESAPNNRIKAYLQTVVTQQQPSYHSYIGAHVAEQLDKAEEAGYTAHLSALKNSAAVDPATADVSARDLKDAIKMQLTKKGLTDPEVIAQAQLAETTSLHSGVINTMMVHNPKAATAYFGMHKEELDTAQRNKFETQLQGINDANVAIESADRVWAQYGPKADGQPVQLDAMEAEVRKTFAGDAGKIKDTIAEIRSRASAFNSSEQERVVTNNNKVLEAFANGASLARLKTMPEYAALPGDKKLDIQKHVEAKALQAESRAAARESRAETAAARAERQTQKKNFAAYLIYSKPDVLAGMSENQLISMLPQLGEQQVANLVSEKRKLDKPEKVIAAQIDQDDFYQSAQAMGLNPYKPGQSEEEKAALGALSFRTKNLIDIEQSRLGRPLSRPEKQSIMRQEAARTVTVDGGWFGSNGDVPVIALKPEQVKKVLLSPEERNQAATRLKIMHERFPQDPSYQPTEDNLRKMHLQSKSLTASDIQ